MLSWALVSKRPLTVIELRDAIAIRPDQRQYERGYLINEADRMISWCCNLLIVDEEDSRVRLPHYSVKEFLLGTRESRKPSRRFKACRFSESEVEIRICHLCCTYLQFSDFKRQVVRSGPRMPDITPKDILNTALTSDSKSFTAKAWLNLKKMQSDERQEEHALGFNLLAKLDVKTTGGLSPLDMDFPLFAYANEYWSQHGSRLTRESLPEWQSFQKLFDSTNVYITQPFPDINWNDPSDLELRTIAQRDHIPLMQNSLRKLGGQKLSDSGPIHRLLALAIKHTSFEVLQSLTTNGEPTGSSALSFIETRCLRRASFAIAMKRRQVRISPRTSYVAMTSML